MVGIQPPVGPGGTPKSTAPTKTTSNNAMDRDAFMKLMIAQMRYQDPTKPMDGAQFLSQSAQFTNIELLEKLQQSQAEMLSFQSVVLSSSLVGKTVIGTAIDGSTVTGKVDAAQIIGGSGVVSVGGKQIPVTAVTEVR